MKKSNEEEINLMLDSYDDIFSDFDPRSYSEKALSVDFLDECHRASVDKTSPELVLMISKSKRNKRDEIEIKRRLTEHFHKHMKEKEETISKIRKEGFIWVIFGIIIVAGSLIISKYQALAFNIVFIIGWFFIWEGTGKILITAKDKTPDYNFYKKMAGAPIEFLNARA